MKHYIQLLFITASFLIFNSSKLSAQWTPTGGPYQGTCYCFAANEQYICAGTDVGLFLSTNNGTDWTPVNIGQSNPVISAVAVFGKDIFVGTSASNRGFVFHSSDFGSTWIKTSFLTGSNVINFAVIGNNLFAGTSANGVYRSTDNGTSWTNIYRSFLVAKSLTAIGTNLFACNSLGVFISTDYGISWSYANSGLTNTCVYSLTTVPGDSGRTNLYAGTAGGGIFLSANNGANWTPVTTGLSDYVISLAIDHSDNNNIFYAGTIFNGVFRSTNNGSNWTKISTGMTSPQINSLIISGSYLFAGTDVDGVYRSSDNGSHWDIANSGFPPNGRIYALASNDSIIFASTESTLFRSTNNGKLWTRILYGLAVKALAVKDNYLYAGTSNGVIYSTDNGYNWNAPKTSPGDYIQAIGVNRGNLYAEGYKVWRSTNDGVDWNLLIDLRNYDYFGFAAGSFMETKKLLLLK
jgi:photosystem II stability/assembly factor-like uncharacterized protein